MSSVDGTSIGKAVNLDAARRGFELYNHIKVGVSFPQPLRSVFGNGLAGNKMSLSLMCRY